jgi:hypothetical protein
MSVAELPSEDHEVFKFGLIPAYLRVAIRQLPQLTPYANHNQLGFSVKTT